MASAFRPSYSETTKDGTRKKWKSKVWYAKYFDHSVGKHRKKKGYPDKAATEQLAARLERQSAQVAEGLRQAPEGQITEHIANYIRHLTARDNSPKYLKDVRFVIDMIVEGCGIVQPSDFSADSLERFLIDRAKTENTSARTWNRYVGAISSFCRYLVKKKLLPSNPFEDFPRRNEEADVRRVRRCVSDEEVARLISAARESGETYYLPGPDRAMLYTLACYTGYRVSELASMTPANFQLDGPNCSVTISAKRSKRRCNDTVPLHGEVAEMFRKYLKTLPQNHLVWPGRWRIRSAQMLRFDLNLAKIPYKDEQGKFFDFHATRGQFISMLALRGVSPAQLRELARHSTIDLTLKVYTRLGIDAGRESVDRLPAPPKPSQV